MLLCGPSAAGKSSLAHALGDGSSRKYWRIRRTTTRPPRRLDAWDAEYEFVSIKVFLDGIAAGSFAEHTELLGCFYGLRQANLTEAFSQENGVSILVCGVSAAMRLSERYPEQTSLAFVYPGSTNLMLDEGLDPYGGPAQVLRNRLQARGDESSHAHASHDYVEARVIRGLSRTAMIIHRIREGGQVEVIENAQGQLDHAKQSLISYARNLELEEKR